MASYGMNDVKNGMKIIVDGYPCTIVDTEYVKPGKGQAFTRVKYRNLKTGRTVELTVREFELLEYLLRHQSHVVSRETLARDVWKETARTTPLDNVIDVHIARLRRKIDAEQSPKLIHTVRGVGFMLREGEP